jgi:methionyl-tRNA formyltransferase
MPAMKTKGIFLMVAFASLTAMAERFAGFWTTVDDESKEKKSVVQVYVHEGKYYGRIVKLFKNQDAVAKLPGSPKICGLDIIWDMKKDGDTLDGGKILVACRDNAVALLTVLPEGKKRMSASDFINGRKIQVGDLLK